MSSTGLPNLIASILPLPVSSG